MMEYEEKVEEINKESEKLKEIFKDIDENKFCFVMSLIDRLAWLNVSVRELEKDIDVYGTKVSYDHGGGQSGIKENPDVRTLIQYTKNITTITKQLIDLVPASAKKSRLEMLAEE